MSKSHSAGGKSPLFDEVKLGRLNLKNRVALAPMTRTSASTDGRATDEMVRYYVKFARGCYSLIITEGTYPDEMHSQGYHNQPGIATIRHVEAWRKVTDAVHSEGASIISQLMHAGALSQGNAYTNETIAPSAVKPKGEQLGLYGGQGEYHVPREMSVEEIQDVVRAFGDAARRAQDAGFDGVEIHGANGYLLDQFLTDYTNNRNDSYGGTTENRARLHTEVLREVRRAVGADFTVGIRVSQGKVNDYEHKWQGGTEDARIIFEALAAAEPDFIHITEYDATLPAFDGETLVGLAKRFGGVPVIANGQLGAPEKAEKLITSGDADVITLGKSALANPDWPRRVLEGASLEEFDFGILQPQAFIKEHEL